MSRYSTRLPKNFEQANEMLGQREERKLINNTYAIRGGNGRVNIVHHNSAIATFEPDGEVTLTNAGYGSVSTRERLNAMTPWNLGFVQKNHAQMILLKGSGDVEDWTYTPGGTVVIAPDGTVSIP